MVDDDGEVVVVVRCHERSRVGALTCVTAPRNCATRISLTSTEHL